MSVNLELSLLLRLDLRNLWLRNLQLPLCQIGGRLSPDAGLIDIDDERFIDEVDFPRSGHLTSSALSACRSLSYTTYTVFRHDVNKFRIDDSKLQIDDFTLQIDDLTLQIGDSTLQIGDSTLQIVDFTLLPASSKRRLDVTTRWIVDINDLPPRRKSISTIRNFKYDDSKLQIGDSKCATVAHECDGAVTQRHPDAATLRSNHSKSQRKEG